MKDTCILLSLHRCYKIKKPLEETPNYIYRYLFFPWFLLNRQVYKNRYCLAPMHGMTPPKHVLVLHWPTHNIGMTPNALRLSCPVRSLSSVKTPQTSLAKRECFTQAMMILSFQMFSLFVMMEILVCFQSACKIFSILLYSETQGIRIVL